MLGMIVEAVESVILDGGKIVGFKLELQPPWGHSSEGGIKAQIDSGAINQVPHNHHAYTCVVSFWSRETPQINRN
jgi:hypothetical protein